MEPPRDILEKKGQSAYTGVLRVQEKVAGKRKKEDTKKSLVKKSHLPPLLILLPPLDKEQQTHLN